MTYQSEWNGFVTQSQSGISEALYVAGVDCSVHPHREHVPDGDSILTPEYLSQPVSAQRTWHAS